MASTKLTLLLTTFLFSSLLFTFSQAKSSKDSEPYVGVNIGTDKITHARLYDADPDILKSLARTKIRVMISVPNNQLLADLTASIDCHVAVSYVT
ncbi:hypothetical protein L484_021948 [Morus notabilis]|uniref:Glucan endo-1,3-beta-D-glucosidase n=1 Tax=Morus notabilis TaxID=981085 RepID=W9QMH6_9ROSA|nr:hypothetical protein L484_021948 [Morus notabilis]